MKKALLHLFTLGLILSMVSHAFSFTNSEKNSSNGLQHKVATNVVKPASVLGSSDTSIFYNIDNDEIENPPSSIDKKNSFFLVDYRNNKSYCSNFICINSLRKNYFSANLSRLPRFNFITLRVLRL
jgi:hypothetical protein